MITSIIEKLSPDFTPAERKIAAYILADPASVTDMSVQSLAKEAAVASSAVMRFCKTLGLGGYSELKIELAKELGGRRVDIPSIAGEKDTHSVVRKVFATGAQTLLDTCNIIDSAKVEEMADILGNARRILIFGVGTSSVIAVDAQYRLSQLGLYASAYTDILFMNVSAANLGPEDVVLAISHSGRTKAVVDAMRSAKASGARTLAITSFSGSLLYKESDLAISVFADEENYPVEAVSARLAHFCLVDALAMSLGTRNFDSFAEHIKARNKILDEIRY